MIESARLTLRFRGFVFMHSICRLRGDFLGMCPSNSVEFGVMLLCSPPSDIGGLHGHLLLMPSRNPGHHPLFRLNTQACGLSFVHLFLLL